MFAEILLTVEKLFSSRYIVSDCDSIEVMVDSHKFLGDTNEDAVAQTVKAGLASHDYY